MLRPQEIELIIPLLLVHQVGQELTPISGHELGGQFDDVQVEGGNGGRVRHELEVRGGLRGRRSLNLLLDLFEQIGLSLLDFVDLGLANLGSIWSLK